MKWYKRLCIVVFVIFGIQKGFSCDVCGSSMSGNAIGLLNAFQFNYAGISWQHIHTSGTSEDRSDVFALVLHQYLGKKWSVQVDGGYAINRRLTTGKPQSISGAMDIRLMLRRTVLSVSTGNNGQYFLNLAGSISAPVGAYNSRMYLQALPEHMNTGNGAWAYGAHVEQLFTTGNWGISQGLSFTSFSKNQVDYRYGNQWIGRLGVFYNINLKDEWTISPQTSLQYELQAMDTYRTGVKDKDTGGQALLHMTGVSAQKASFAYVINVGLPISYTANTQSSVSQWRLMIQANYLF